MFTIFSSVVCIFCSKIVITKREDVTKQISVKHSEENSVFREFSYKYLFNFVVFMEAEGEGGGRLFEFEWEWEGGGVGVGAYSRLGAY